jgi:signal transduction histidine kinase
MGYRLPLNKGGSQLSLNKKFALIIILALIINLLGIALYLKLFIARDISIGIQHLNTEFSVFMQDLGPDTTLRELRIILSEKLQDSSFLNVIFYKLVSDNIRYSLMLLPVLLGTILFYMNKEVIKPLNKLNEAINQFNRKNGYHKTKHSRNEILKLSNNFFVMSEQIESTKRKKNEFISCISHDLKTPLTSILGYTQRLIDPGIADKEKRLKYYQTILNKANDIQNMVEELNNYVMGEIQEVSLRKVNLKKFLDEVAEEYFEELLTYNIHLIPTIDLNENVFSFLDDIQIRRVFANVFSNSVIHGGKNMQIMLHAYIKNEKLIVNLENDGPSLPDMAYDKVFDLMYQADTARTPQQQQGRGLGLAIVKQIIEKHNGSISAYGPSHGGFGLEFQLPIIQL